MEMGVYRDDTAACAVDYDPVACKLRVPIFGFWRKRATFKPGWNGYVLRMPVYAVCADFVA